MRLNRSLRIWKSVNQGPATVCFQRMGNWIPRSNGSGRGSPRMARSTARTRGLLGVKSRIANTGDRRPTSSGYTEETFRRFAIRDLTPSTALTVSRVLRSVRRRPASPLRIRAARARHRPTGLSRHNQRSADSVWPASRFGIPDSGRDLLAAPRPLTPVCRIRRQAFGAHRTEREVRCQAARCSCRNQAPRTTPGCCRI
jgi:hypothetical protein